MASRKSSFLLPWICVSHISADPRTVGVGEMRGTWPSPRWVKVGECMLACASRILAKRLTGI